jgi:hypothetical protein
LVGLDRRGFSDSEFPLPWRGRIFLIEKEIRRTKMKIASTTESRRVCGHGDRKMKPSHCEREWIEFCEGLQLKEVSQDVMVVEGYVNREIWLGL